MLKLIVHPDCLVLVTASGERIIRVIKPSKEFSLLLSKSLQEVVMIGLSRKIVEFIEFREPMMDTISRVQGLCDRLGFDCVEPYYAS